MTSSPAASNGLSTEKRQLRRLLRARRRALPAWRQRRAALDVMRRVARIPEFRAARRIAAYIAHDGELDPAPLVRLALARGKQVYLPVLHPGGRLRLFRVGPGTRWRRNRFGIAEPRGGDTLPFAALDLVLMPLVGFDAGGGRLGMGAGYYDRSLADVPVGRPLLMGLAHSCQQVAALPLEPWDRPLQQVVTERGLFRPAAAARRSVQCPG